MIVSWNWLKQYVRLDCSVEELTNRLMMAGFNLEGTADVDGDIAIDLEITSNRPDCLGHLGVAREIAVLLGTELKLPECKPEEAGPDIKGKVAVEIAADADWCPQYRARLIEGVKIGPSPDWMQRRLKTLGLRPVNNVVDVTNYVMLECGQPLHAFDFAKVKAGKIVVRNAKSKEKFEAINHKEYELTPEFGVIADASDAVALAGVMGGASTEIGPHTTSVLLESAEFLPLSIRRTSRALDLSSDSSYRFERRIDPEGIAWASDRAAKLIAETSGGKVAKGFVHAGKSQAASPEVTLRWQRIGRILGIEITKDEAKHTLERLGVKLIREDSQGAVFSPPSFRRDLTREIDLIEEVGRVHGYADVPEDRSVPLVASPRGKDILITDSLRDLLAGLGYYEAVTFSFTDPDSVASIRPWTNAEPFTLNHSKARHENSLRQSLLPSLLKSIQMNEARGNRDVSLYEMAHGFHPVKDQFLPHEPMLLGMARLTNGDDKDAVHWRTVRGHLEAMFEKLRVAVEWSPADVVGFAPGKSLEIKLDGKRVGVLGYPADPGEIRGTAVLAELTLNSIFESADLLTRTQLWSDRPAVARDLAVVFDDATAWADLEKVVRREAGNELESLTFVDLYRGKQVPPGKKSIAFRMLFRAADRTLTHEEVDVVLNRIVAKLGEEFGGVLRA